MRKAVNTILGVALALLCLPEIILGGMMKDKNLEVYLVSMPIGYGALSAYNALPTALHHAPYALNIFGSGYLGDKIGLRSLQSDGGYEERNGAEEMYPRIEYGLDLATFLKKLSRQSAELGK